MKPMNILIILSLIMLSATCKKENTEDCHHSITVVNQSEKDIYVHEYLGYPDTVYFKHGPNPVLSPELNKVKAGESNTNALWGRDCWEIEFENFIVPSEKIMIFIFDAQVLESTSWDTVVSNYMVLKRYDLSLEDLKQLDFTITYP